MRISHEIIVIAVCGILLSVVPIEEIPWSVGFACATYLAGIWIFYEYKHNAGWLYYNKWLLIWYIVYILLAPIGLYLYGKTTEIDTFEYIPASMVLSAFGFSWFLIGIKKVIRNHKFEVVIPQIPNSFVAKANLVLLAWAAIVLQLSAYMSLIPRSIADQVFLLILIPSLVFITANDIKALKGKVIPLIPFVAPGIFFLLSSTDLQETKEKMLLLTAFPLLFGYVTSKYYNRKNLIIIGGITVLLFVSLFPIVNAVRDEVRLTGKTTNVVEISKSIVLGEREIRWEYILHRLSVIQYLAGIVRNETGSFTKRPSDPQWIILGPLIVNIPGFLFDKTGIDPNHAQAAGVMLGIYGNHTISNLAVTVIGNILWAYSWPGVAIIMLALGIFTAFMNKYLMKLLSHHWLYFFPYLATLLCFFHLESDVNAYVTFPLRILVILFFVSHLFANRRIGNPGKLT